MTRHQKISGLGHWAKRVVVAGALLGCDVGESPEGGGAIPEFGKRKPGTPPAEVEKRLGLKVFDSCDSLEVFIEDGMVEEMKVQIDLQQRGGLTKGGLGRPETALAPQAGAAAAPAADSSRTSPTPPPAGSSAASPTAVTRTNVQVQGVDEADFVKNDKNRIFVLSGQKLFASLSWPPQSLALKQALVIDGQPREMFLDEKRNRIVVISETGSVGYTARTGGPQPATDLAIAPGPAGSGVPSAGPPTVKLTVVDVTNIDKLEVVDSFFVPGSYVNARRVDAAVRVVVTDHFVPPETIQYSPDGKDASVYNDKAKLASAFSQLKTSNEKLIRARSLDDWLPKTRVVRRGAMSQSLAYACGDFHYSNAPTKMGLVTVATLNLDNPGAQPARTSVVAEPGEIYASNKALYVASRHWWWWPETGQINFTYVHKFDTTDATRTVYRASGGFDGHIVDQFSMDEYNDVFRVATTINKVVAQPGGGGCCANETWNRITTLGEKSGALAILGTSEDLAKGERIYSSRFQGDRGYVVTFRQVDPLYTFDLSNPTNPRKVGLLKVPGYSSYIHPLDKDHLLTIGVYTPDPTTTNQPSPGMGVAVPTPAIAAPPIRANERKVQLAIFDVSNFAEPKQTHLFLIGTSSGSSEALDEHKAFNYFPEKKLLAIPFTDYNVTQSGARYWETFISDLRVFEIDAVAGIKARGRLDMKDVFVKNNLMTFAPGYAPYIRRSVMATDGPNDFVYAVSDAGIRVGNLANLMTPVATATFPPGR